MKGKRGILSPCKSPLFCPLWLQKQKTKVYDLTTATSASEDRWDVDGLWLPRPWGAPSWVQCGSGTCRDPISCTSILFLPPALPVLIGAAAGSRSHIWRWKRIHIVCLIKMDWNRWKSWDRTVFSLFVLDEGIVSKMLAKYYFWGKRLAIPLAFSLFSLCSKKNSIQLLTCWFWEASYKASLVRRWNGAILPELQLFSFMKFQILNSVLNIEYFWWNDSLC